ncbi:MAG: glucosaminidase domain-containing protein [Bacteroidales bacterium]|nr:glucosaminidase domain-containing protein [Bacteroidales bacterium]
MRNYKARYIPVLFGAMFVAAMFVATACKKRFPNVETIEVAATDTSDIIAIDDSLVVPVDYIHVFPLDKLSTESRKRKFIDIMLPSILVTRFQLVQLRDRVLDIERLDSLERSHDQMQLIDTLLVKYKSQDIEELSEKLIPHPPSIALAQAALECAWGTSRFFYEANNPFGIWSFFGDEPRISSLQPRDGSQVYLRKYSSLKESVENYYFVISTGPYKEFREKRLSSSDPFELIPYLYNYSEMRSAYVEMVRDIIRQNNLEKYDNYQIEPDYIRD